MPVFSWGQKRAESLRNPCVLGGGGGAEGTISEVATSPLPSHGLKEGQNCYVSPAFSGDPPKRDKIRSGYLTPGVSGVQRRAELLHNPYVPKDPPKRGQ